MTTTSLLQAPTRGQFELNSAPCQSYNCGPTDAAFIDGFYHDRKLSIDYVRRLASAYCQGTTAVMVATMLSKLGITSDPHYGTTIALIKSIIANRTRPIAVAVYMNLIPDQFTNDPFNGGHWLVCCANTYLNGASAVVVMDSNAPSSTGGFHTIPDWALAQALMGDAAIPRSPKTIRVIPKVTFSRYAALRVASIPPNATIYGYNPNYPGAPVKTFKATSAGSSFKVNGKSTVSWPDGVARVPNGTFLHGDPTYGGVFATLLVIPSTVRAADGKPW